MASAAAAGAAAPPSRRAVRARYGPPGPVTTHDGERDNPGGGSPTVILAALGVALLVAVGMIAWFSSLGGGDGSVAADRPAATTATTADQRVLLIVSVEGSGIGRVQIEPSVVSCIASCEYRFRADTRVTATVRPSPGSTFEGWGDACSGKKRCSFVMDRPRSLSATFAEKPVSDPLCEDVPAEDRDPTCPPDDLADPDPPPPPRVPGPDCFDSLDNDDDGLTDTAQDPDCETSGSEAGTAAPPDDPASPPPPPAALPNQCTDGEDNDNDGLTDREQDPDCEKGRSESG